LQRAAYGAAALASMSRIAAGEGPAIRSVSSTPTLRVKLLGEDGKPMPEWRLKTLYADDLHFEPIRRRSKILDDGTVEIEILPGPTALHAKIEIPGFGDAWVIANNKGEGYRETSTVLDLVRETAESRMSDIERLRQEHLAVRFSAECYGHGEAAKELLELANKPGQSAKWNLMALSHALWAGELAIVEVSRHMIARRPKRDGYLFGCNAFAYRHDTPYAQRFRDVLNFATLPFYLRRLEPQEGKPDYRRVDEILEWCEKVGITPKGHPLWWGHQAGIPDWLKGADWAAAQKHCARVVSRSVERYRNRINIWDIINEAHDWANGLNLTHEQEVEITKVCADAARQKNPDAKLIVNNCCPFGEYAAEGRVHLGPVYDKVFTPLSYLDAVMKANVDFDIVGVQIYFPARDMLSISKLLDEYARFGKPVNITELGVRTITASRRDELPTTEWHMPWCEKVQADWVEWFYTMCYARPEITAITWWDFKDPAFIPTSGYLREDETPRESFFRLKALEHSWGFDFSKSS
jgi:endo-1,4-beta-xylanase